MNAALPTDCALQLCSAAVEVAPLPPERLLALGGEPAAAFIAPQGRAWVGLGAARWLPAGAADAAALWSGMLDESPAAPPPVALGALPFAPGERPDPGWQGLAPGGIFLPERLYLQHGDRAWWRLTLPLREAGSLVARLAQTRRSLATLAAVEADAIGGWKARPEGDSPSRYVDAVTQAVQRIAAGELVKVVLSRRAAVVFDSPPPAAAVLARLGLHHPGCVRYALRRGGKTWLGATPETLVRVEGRRLSTLALAGTRPSARADELLGSAKDRHEHAVVVQAIRDAVTPFTRDLRVPDAPVVRRLRGLAHLQTPIEATLAEGTDFLRLVHALHPTPAVCGLPAAQAGALLRTLEKEPRGLYAGPFVRLSPGGDGHAVVALRGLLLDGRHALLPAGAGIVAGSDGDAELAETRVKQLSVLDALLSPAQRAQAVSLPDPALWPGATA